MTSAALALQKAVYAAFVADDGVGALITDRISTRAAPCHLPLRHHRPTTLADWSTGSEDGAEHRLTLDVWSRAHGKSECHAIADAIGAALHDAALALAGHRWSICASRAAIRPATPTGSHFTGDCDSGR